jgi:hypothetical protein
VRRRREAEATNVPRVGWTRTRGEDRGLLRDNASTESTHSTPPRRHRVGQDTESAGDRVRDRLGVRNRLGVSCCRIREGEAHRGRGVEPRQERPPHASTLAARRPLIDTADAP